LQTNLATSTTNSIDSETEYITAKVNAIAKGRPKNVKNANIAVKTAKESTANPK
jgi:hypothetical protein